MDAYHDAGIAVLQPAAVEYDQSEALANVECFLWHESGQWARSALAMKPNTSTPQSVGSALTYGKRYGILGMSGLAPEEDDDGKKASAAPPKAAAPPRARIIGKADLQKFDAIRQRIDPKELGDVVERVTSGLRKGGGVRNLAQILETERAEVWVALHDRIKALTVDVKVGEGQPQQQSPAQGAPTTT